MPVSSRQIAEFYRKDPHNPILRELVILSLSPCDRKLVAHLDRKRLLTPGGWVTTSWVAKGMGWSVPNTGNRLLRLYRLGLVRRERVNGETGLYYRWWLRS